jgi:hypothetical protein
MLEVAPASEGEQAYTPYLSLFSSPNSIFLFGTRNRIPIEEHLVKVESEEDLDQDSGAIGTMEFLQKGKDTQSTITTARSSDSELCEQAYTLYLFSSLPLIVFSFLELEIESQLRSAWSR